MTPRSPFQYQRWETDDQHIIWPPREFAEWEGKRCVYFTGSRGSGKTTLLRAFEWSQRLYNDSLKEQLESDPFAKRYIGVYLEITDYIATRFINWPPKREGMNDAEWEGEKARLYCLYLEYQILNLFVEAILELRGNGVLKFSPEDEIEIIKKLLSERPEINNFVPEKKDKIWLNDLKLGFKFMHEIIGTRAIYKLDITPNDGFPTLQMGKMLEEVAGLLIDLCSRNDSKNNESLRWMLKVCIDQAESQEPYQQKAINTMVARLKTGDVSFVVAFLSGNSEIRETYIPHHPLIDADRQHVSLEDAYKNSAKFNEFVTAVTELRFRKFASNNHISVNLRHILGSSDINSLLYNISFKKTEKPIVRDFIEKAKKDKKIELLVSKKQGVIKEKNSIDEFNLDDYLPNDEVKNIPPFYHIYLINKLKLDISDIDGEKHTIRSLKSREFRKKMVSAMLCLCKEYKVPIPYAGYTMVMSMSDQCIRDFLRIMHEIYLENGTSPEDFVNRELSPITQDIAIHSASQIRYTGIDEETAHHTSEIKNLVDSLGKMTSEIQSAYNDPSSLKTVERGRFDVDISRLRSEKEQKELKEIIQEASDSHCIKIIQDYSGNNRIIFRLHRLFAPKFGFSYRGALSNVPLPGDILLKLCNEKDRQLSDKVINRFIQNIIRSGNHASLDIWVGHDD